MPKKNTQKLKKQEAEQPIRCQQSIEPRISTAKMRQKIVLNQSSKSKNSLPQAHKNHHRVPSSLNTKKSKHQATSKRSIKLHRVDASHKIDDESGQENIIETDKYSNHFQKLNLPSFLEYCVVDQTFIPLINSNQKRFVSNLIGNTLSTSDYWHEHHKQRDHSQNSQKKSIFLHQSKQVTDIWSSKKLLSQADKETMVYLAEAQQQGVEAQVDQEDFGTQYSERKLEDTQQKQKNEEDLISKKTEEETLDEILLKLQFLHLPNQSVFERLSCIQKQHYTELLQSVLQKLEPSPRIIQSKTSNDNFSHLILSKSDHKADIKQISDDEYEFVNGNFIEMGAEDALHNELQLQVCLREEQQINQLPLRTSDAHHYDYTLFGIIQWASSFFCFVELNYIREFVSSMNRVYGLSYKERFNRSKNGFLATNLPLRKILPDDLFLDFLQQIISEEEGEESGFISQPKEFQTYKSIFFRCVFDFINGQIDTYRAFYTSEGEPFPWSTTIVKSLTFYTIDHDAVEIIFEQIKQKLAGVCSLLTGILVDPVQQLTAISCSNPVIRRRSQRENKMMLQWMKTIDDNPSTEVQVTKVLLSVGDWLTQILFLEAIADLQSIQK